MKTTPEQITLLWHLINQSALSGIITGGVYKYQRPADSKVEDIVVNAIAIDNELVQTGTGNVNIHVPALTNGMPNTSRIEQLATIAETQIKEGFGSKYTFFVENQTVIYDPETQDWFINFRIKFKFHNT